MNYEIKNSYFHKIIRDQKFSEFSEVRYSCFLILDYLIVAGRDLEVSFSFDELRENIDQKISDEDFITSVFYLTREDIKILDQGFSAWKAVEDRYVEVKKEKVLRMINSKQFSHPYTGIELTEDQFFEEVIPFFAVTKYFLDHKNDSI